MWDQEKDHLKLFSKLMIDRRVRPTALLPIWNVAGYALGMYFIQFPYHLLDVCVPGAYEPPKATKEHKTQFHNNPNYITHIKSFAYVR